MCFVSINFMCFVYLLVPSQQAPPTHRPISPTVLELNWVPPDHPNGVILTYILFRDGAQIAQLAPFG